MDSRLLALASLLQIGLSQANLHEISRRRLDPEGFLGALDAAALAGLGIREDRIARILAAHAKHDADGFTRMIESSGVRILAMGDIDFPAMLAPLPNMPAILYVRGSLSDLPMIAVVGSRKPTDYSGRILRQWIPAFVADWFAIASGGAYGVDSLAHSIALDAGGSTVAVLGTGIDVAYPASHAPLYARIVAQGGATVSQFAFGTPGGTYTFPIRNATIAGLSRAVLVTEAAEKSGSLITARLGNDFGREVFAVPGDVFRDSSAGTNLLIRSGEALAVSSASDVLGALDRPVETARSATSPTDTDLPDPIDRRIIATLRAGGLGIDALSQRLDIDATSLTVRLAELEFRDLLIRQPHGNYELR